MLLLLKEFVTVSAEAFQRVHVQEERNIPSSRLPSMFLHNTAENVFHFNVENLQN